MKKLWIIIDTSGSMFESGKRLIARGIVREVEQYLRLGFAQAEPLLLSANNNTTEITWNPDEEYPEKMFNCHGVFNAKAVINCIQEKEGLFLLISDGDIGLKQEKVLQRWAENMPEDSLRVIVAGGDTMTGLRKHFKVFSSTEVLSALDDWIESDKKNATTEDEDEW